MNSIIKTLALFACAFLAFSCVDLNQDPTSFLTEEEYIQMPQSIEMVNKSVDGLYNDLWFDNYGFNCRMMRFNTAGDDLLSAPKPNNSIAYLIDLSPSASANNADATSVWRNFWKVITSSNKIINGTPLPADEVKADKIKKSIAEAYFMRAFSYYYLVRIFGNVPIIKSGAEALQPQSRREVADVYNQIIVPDLLKAIADLPTTSRSTTSSTPSKYAAKTCLADVYMTMAGWPLKKGTEYYAKAAALSLEVITESGLFLTPKYDNLWKEALKTESNEHIFTIQHSAKFLNPSQYGKSFYPRDFSPNGGWADYYANPAFMDKFPADDRKAFCYMTSWKTAKGVVTWQNSQDKLPCISKYFDYNEGVAGKSAQSNGITPIFRYAHVLLMYAEASNLATGTVNSKALECIQKVQSRSRSPLTTTTDSKAFDDAVFAERGWEFMAEFTRWFDIVRRDKAAEIKPDIYNKSLYKANNHFYYPIPSDEVQMTGWTNNAGY